MGWRLILIASILLVAGTIAGIVFAQLGDTHMATGSINVTTISSDLYICEPDSTPGPDCGSDDSGGDEAVFEALENMRPGDLAQWDLRLKNVGTADWWLTGVTLNIVETVDPIPPGLTAASGDCPDRALAGERFGDRYGGISILGTSTGDGYDEINDNVSEDRAPPGVPLFIRNSQFNLGEWDTYHIKVASGDYEDVRLRLQLAAGGTKNCDGNQWDVSWQFTVN